MSNRDTKTYFATKRGFIHKKKLKIISIIIISLLSLTSIILWTDVPVWNYYISPDDYKINFGVYGSLDNTLYSSKQKSELNEHKVTFYGIDKNVANNASKTSFINEMLYWKENYSNIEFYITVSPLDQGVFVWDGNAEQVIEYAKEFITIIQDYSLTNVKGLSFDWETPLLNGKHIILPLPDSERHEKSLELWEDFFDWKTNRTTLEMVVFIYLSLAGDVVNDNDYDLHQIYNTIVFELPYWDRYIPMIYRSFPHGEKPWGNAGDTINLNLDGVDLTYEYYRKIELNMQGIKKTLGTNYLDKTAIIIGLSNTSAYTENKDIIEFQQNLGTGFDVLIRDVKIAKHFKIPEIVFFVLNSFSERGYNITGLFESYGDDFLDIINTRVNSEDSNTPFAIPIGHLFNLITDLELGLATMLDWMYGILPILWILIILLIVFFQTITAILWYYLGKRKKVRTN